MKTKRNLLWLGVTPLEKFSDRVDLLVEELGSISVNFPNTTEGMIRYDQWANYLDEWDVIATDQEHIDESWENFFVAQNWGKQIIQFKDNKWSEVLPGFSKNYPKGR